MFTTSPNYAITLCFHLFPYGLLPLIENEHIRFTETLYMGAYLTEVSQGTLCGCAGGLSLSVRGRQERHGSKDPIKRQVSHWQVFSITAHLLIRKMAFV